jgi:hypothetical protein
MSKAAELAALIGSQTALSNRNLIINGAMQVAQRGTSAVTVTSTGEYPNVDRYAAGGNDSSLISVEQSTDAPSGFEYSLKVTSLAASTTDAADYQFIGQRVEGYNTAQLDWGASGAKTVTVSFYVKCSVTGNIPFVIVNSSDTRVYAANCTVSSANTWEYKTITVEGDTAGTWLKTNGIGLKIQWYMALGSNFQGTLDQWGTAYGASGQINVCNTNNATFQVTGVQLEVGEQATPFEHRSYGDELRRCQRYAYKIGGSRNDTFGAGQGLYQDGNEFNFGPYFPPVTLRANPSLTVYGTAPGIKINGGANTGFTSTISGPFNEMQFIRLTKASHGLSSSHVANMNFASTSDYIILDAEL